MLKDFQDKCFEMYKCFSDLCNKHNITYFLTYGSAIGAARENDFIPWDDDIDIMLTRSQYNKLKSVIHELDSRYKFVEPSDYPPYIYDFIPHLIDLKTIRRNATEEDIAYSSIPDKMCMDFYIIDNAPDSRIKQNVLKLNIYVLYCMSRAKRYNSKIMAGEVKYPFLKKAVAKLLYLIGKPFSREWYLRKYDALLTKYNRIETNTVYTGCSPATYLGFYPKEYFCDVVYMPFHCDMVPLPIGYDSILQQIYGDYMHPDKDRTKYIQHVDDSWNQLSS